MPELSGGAIAVVCFRPELLVFWTVFYTLYALAVTWLAALAAAARQRLVGGSQFLGLGHLTANERIYAWWYATTPVLRDRLLLQGISPGLTDGL